MRFVSTVRLATRVDPETKVQVVCKCVLCLKHVPETIDEKCGLGHECFFPEDKVPIEGGNAGALVPFEPRGGPCRHGTQDGEVDAMHIGPGSLTWYSKKNTFYAYCDDARHGGRGKCRLNRTAASGNRRGQGRPLGFLAAWLLDHEAHADRLEHVAARPSREARVSARDFLKQLPEGSRFLAYERPERPDDGGSEPEVVQ